MQMSVLVVKEKSIFHFKKEQNHKFRKTRPIKSKSPLLKKILEAKTLTVWRALTIYLLIVTSNSRQKDHLKNNNLHLPDNKSVLRIHTTPSPPNLWESKIHLKDHPRIKMKMKLPTLLQVGVEPPKEKSAQAPRYQPSSSLLTK